MDYTTQQTRVFPVTGTVRYFLCLAHQGGWANGLRVTLTGTATVSGSGAPLGVLGLVPVYEDVPTATVSRGMYDHIRVQGQGQVILTGFVPLVEVGAGGHRI